jgi:invasion protein IalB
MIAGRFDMALRRTAGIAVGGFLAACLIAAGAAVSLAEPDSLPAWGTGMAKSSDKAAGNKTADTEKKKTGEKGQAGKSEAARQPAKGAPIETGALPQQNIKSEPFADWVRECRAIKDNKNVCTLRQTVRDGKKRRIIEFVAARTPKTAFLEIKLPLGVSIPYGVTLNLADNIKLPTQLVDCNLGGCRSVIALDDKTLGQLKGAKSLGVSFQDSRSGKVITIGGSIKGFNDALAKGIGLS